jgi:hypothetical protein
MCPSGYRGGVDLASCQREGSVPPVCRVLVWCGDVHIVVTASSPTKSPLLVLEVFLWLGDLRIFMKLHRRLILLPLQDGCGLFYLFGDFRPQLTTSGCLKEKQK